MLVKVVWYISFKIAYKDAKARTKGLLELSQTFLLHINQYVDVYVHCTSIGQ